MAINLYKTSEQGREEIRVKRLLKRGVMSIIVDGYNYIGRSQELTLQDESAREKLIFLFGQYCARAKKTLTLIFDGSYGGAEQVDRKRQYGRVTVIYTSPIYTADHAIKKLVSEQEPRHRKSMLIVSSDAEVFEFARSHGAGAAKAEEFEQQLLAALTQPPQVDRVNIHVTDEEVQEWLKLFGTEPAEQKKPARKSRELPTEARMNGKQDTRTQPPQVHQKPHGKERGLPVSDDDERRDHVRLSSKEVDEWMKIFGGGDD